MPKITAGTRVAWAWKGNVSLHVWEKSVRRLRKRYGRGLEALSVRGHPDGRQVTLGRDGIPIPRNPGSSEPLEVNEMLLRGV